VSTLVVARYRDGKLVKGISMDLDPRKPTCHVRPPAGAVVEVKLAELKALFLVKTLEGNSQHDENLMVPRGDRRSHGTTIVEVRFEDNERLVGFTNRFPPNQKHYFVVPVDLNSNNIRVLVNSLAVKSIEPTTLPADV
jgi:hypothetical protein